jgi:ankyrin repeat protein
VELLCLSAHVQGGNTALHLAARAGHLEVAQLLLRSGAAPYVLNKARPTLQQEGPRV